MQYIDMTFPTPQHNLACDEALVALCEKGYEHEILRFWEPREHFVVLGYSNRVLSEIDLSACQQNRIPIFRRCSGGGAVLQGQGCLNYALVLEIPTAGPLSNISATNAFIMQRHQTAIQQIIGSRVEIQGFTDLVQGNLKFSGNAQYRKRRFLLYHGTFLLQLDLSLMERVLRMPQRQPSYRQNRPHQEFLINLNLRPALVKRALREAWGAAELFRDIHLAEVEGLAEGRYSSEEWNFKY